MRVKILHAERGSVAIGYQDSAGLWQGRVVSAEVLKDRSGNIAYVEEESLQAGIEYGIDMSVFIQEPYTIDAAELQQVLRVHGLWTEHDMISKRAELIRAVYSLTNRIIMDVIASVNEM